MASRDRFLKIKSVYLAARELPMDKRQHYLVESCSGDISMQNEVEVLLNDNDAESFYKTTANELTQQLLSIINNPENRFENTLQAYYISRNLEESHSSTSLIGKVIKGRYYIVKEIGQGGMGVVYLAHDRNLLDKPVVVKIMFDKANEWAKKKFKQEVESLSRIDHPGVVRPLDTGEDADGKPFFVMEYIEGDLLRSFIKPLGMDSKQTAYFIYEICQALSAVHAKGIYHRDLKPENILVKKLESGKLQIKLIDFGIARVNNSQLGEVTIVDSWIGTLSYMASEQLRQEPVSPATDIFALGIIVYEMLTGQHPFINDANSEKPSFYKLLELQKIGVNGRLRAIRPDLSEDTETVILKALSFDPEERYQCPLLFGEELARVLGADVKITRKIDSLTLEKPLHPVLSIGELNIKSSVSESKAEHTNKSPLLINNTVTPKISESVEAQESDNKRTFAQTKNFNKSKVIYSLAIFLLLLVASFIFLFLSSSPDKNPVVEIPLADKTIRFFALVQKLQVNKRDKDNRPIPIGAPAKLYTNFSGSIYFQDDDGVRLNFDVSKNGYFYLLNEGPSLVNGNSVYTVLYPSALNNFLSEISSNKVINIPNEKDWLYFQKNKGTEKFWLVWSKEKIEILEDMKLLNNAVDRGILHDPTSISTLKGLLDGYKSYKPQVQVDEENKQSQISFSGDRLIYLLKLEHR